MKQALAIRLNAIHRKVAVGAFVATCALASYADGVDFAAAATDFKTQALAALAAIGLAVLAVAAAIAAFRKGKSLIR